MNWLVIIGFIAIFQGIYLAITSSTLSFARKTKTALVILMGSHVVLLLTVIFYEMDWYVLYPHFLYVRVPIPLLIGPCLYLLYKGIFHSEQLEKTKFFPHFIPFFFYLILLMPYYIQSSSVKLNAVSIDKYTWGSFEVIEQLKIIHFGAYLLWIFWMHRYQSRQITNKLQHFFVPYQKLFLWILIAYVAIFFLSFLNATLMKLGINLLYKAEFLIATITTLLTYFITYVFIKYDSQWQKAFQKLTERQSEGGAQIIAQLVQLMEAQKLYRNNDLKIIDVAASLGISKQDLSKLINHELNTNFAQFVNAYRIKDFKSRVVDPQESYKTLLGLAYEAGFNSKSSFQRIFKEATGMTPNAYKKAILKRSQ